MLRTSISLFGGHMARSVPIPVATTSPPFAASENLLLLAQVAETWSCRPSELVEADGTTALQLDLACAVALWRRRQGIGSREL